MRIGELAEAVGVSTDTVRFYERSGWLPRASRRDNAYRDYGPADVEHLRLIIDLRRLDLPLEDAARIAGWCHSGHCGDSAAELPRMIAGTAGRDRRPDRRARGAGRSTCGFARAPGAPTPIPCGPRWPLLRDCRRGSRSRRGRVPLLFAGAVSSRPSAEAYLKAGLRPRPIPTSSPARAALDPSSRVRPVRAARRRRAPTGGPSPRRAGRGAPPGPARRRRR